MRIRRAMLVGGITVLAIFAPAPPAVSEDRAIDALPRMMLNPKDGAEMVLVPGGAYRAENIHLREPATRKIDSYYIYRYLVTIAQYRTFCAETGRTAPAQPEWKERDGLLRLFPERWFQGETFAPVSNVSWDDAQAYCRWAGVTLTTDGQWEMAAWGARGSREEGKSSSGAEDFLLPQRQWCEFNEEDRASSPELKSPRAANLRSVRGTYGPFDPNPSEHSSLAGKSAPGQSFRGARAVRL